MLFDHLFAKHLGGQHILRIEDTDRTRYNEESEREFVETLHWVGIDFDEGPHVGGPHAPYRQSERKEAGIYAEQIQILLANGHAYKAFETPEELDEMREYQKINKLSTGYYGGKWRDATPEQVSEAEASGKPYVIRQRMPRDVKIVTQDAIRGRVEVDSNLLTDPVLIKADGMPTYHFAAMVDDHLMKITHVLRGDEWLPSFPMHWTLYEQFGWEKPVFVHCPVIVGTDGKKLSKRHGATRVLDYGAQGYTKDALKNFIALIGWSPGDEREVMTEAELIEAFSLDGMQPSPGQFDIEKLRWLNGHRIRKMDPNDLLDALLSFARDPYTESYWATFVDENPVPNKPPIDGKEILRKLKLISDTATNDRPYVLAALKEEQQRVQTLADFGEAMEFFLVEEPEMDEKAIAKWFKEPHVPELFDWILAKLDESRVETAEHYETIVKAFQSHKGLEKLGPVVHPTRVALTGKTAGPGLFELMAVLGHDRIERRIRRAQGML
ncbi:glutamyl-tRNA synthetase [Fimbriimonas ginsengisoli Gsoil 348]|uniref:Glutamate--tRNA ligase n=1 Tax=Fimbriimonas ginsengisoli Gsoil 348 TaxID=661478 RepID=A0A068NLK3_FIMGI|nr:glutamyl-tRNA synthetase [Fimbriimonas ginsengisoli Gsoil 348]